MQRLGAKEDQAGLSITSVHRRGRANTNKQIHKYANKHIQIYVGAYPLHMLVLVYLYLKKLMNHSQKYSEFLGLISICELLWACQFEGRWARWPRKRIKNARPPDYHASLSRARRRGSPSRVQSSSTRFPSSLVKSEDLRSNQAFGHLLLFPSGHLVMEASMFVFYLCLCI